MARVFKARAGGVRVWKTGTMAQLTDVAKILTTAERGDGDDGTYVAPVRASVLCVADGGTAYGATAIDGQATLPLAADVQSGAADYGVFGALRRPGLRNDGRNPSRRRRNSGTAEGSFVLDGDRDIRGVVSNGHAEPIALHTDRHTGRCHRRGQGRHPHVENALHCHGHLRRRRDWPSARAGSGWTAFGRQAASAAR